MFGIAYSLTAQKPIIVFAGTCQAQFVSKFFARLPELKREYEFVEILMFDKRSGFLGKLNEYIAANKDRIAIVAAQKMFGLLDTKVITDQLAPHTKAVFFPAGLLTSLWPLIKYEPGDLSRRYPDSLQDCIVNELRSRDLTDEQFLDAYFSVDVPSRFPLDIAWRNDRGRARMVDRGSDFSLWSRIEAMLTGTKLFRTMYHPNGVLLAEVIEAVADGLGIVADRIVFDARLDQVRGGVGIGWLEAPIHPQVAAHFGLEWARGEPRYHFWDEGDITFKEYILHLYRRSPIAPQAKAAKQRLIAKDFAGAVELYRAAVELSPRSVRFRLNLGGCLSTLKEYSGAAKEYLEAYEIEPTAATAGRIVSMLFLDRRTAEGEAFLDQALARHGDHVELLLPRAAQAQSANRFDEALAILMNAERVAPAEHRVQVAIARLVGRKDKAEAWRRFEHAYYLSGWDDRLLDKAQRMLGDDPRKAAA